MMPNVRMPDGVIVRFPDTMQPDQIKAMILTKFPDAKAAAAAPSQGYNDALADASARSQSLAPKPQEPAGPDLMGATAATLGGIVNGVPILGPVLQNTSDALMGAGAVLTGGDYGKTVEGLRDRRVQLAEANPVADIAGQLAGGVGAFGAAAKIPAAAEALGVAGKSVLPRILNSATSGAAISAGDTVVRGGAVDDVLRSGGIGAAVGGAIPAAGAVVGLGVKAAGRALEPTINAIHNSGDEALRRLGNNVARDAATNPASMMSAADEVVAREAGVPVLNADRGGEVTRALTRSVANQSPEARAVIQNAANDRFGTQGTRAVDFVKRLTGGAADDIGYQKAIKSVAKAVNKPRYDMAYAAPQAQAIWTPEIRNLMQAGPFRAAINEAETTATNAAAVSGGKAVRNPFEFRQDGTVTLRTNPDGSRALPSLQFWDIVQRNLRNSSELAQRSGDNLAAAQVGAMRTQLLDTLDTAVPLFQQARRGAASFFDADDALEAGKKFATQPKAIPEAREAFEKFTGAEKQAFQTGYASELIDRIKSSRDRVNVINSVFGSQASREMASLVFGKQKAAQLEAYVRVEGIVDQLRGALGNSTTARQLAEMGLGAGGGALLTGGDWKGAVTGAAAAKGVRYLGTRVDEKVLQDLARLLTSDDPKLIQEAVARAAIMPSYMQALAQIEKAVSAPVRGLAISGVTAPAAASN